MVSPILLQHPEPNTTPDPVVSTPPLQQGWVEVLLIVSHILCYNRPMCLLVTKLVSWVFQPLDMGLHLHQMEIARRDSDVVMDFSAFYFYASVLLALHAPFLHLINPFL